jgi:steroid 5-alpha reductase family enzyme
MSFINIWLHALILIIILMTILWIISVIVKNVSIVDLFWGPGFAVTGGYYLANCAGSNPRKVIILTLVVIWAARLAIHLAIRNAGKGEDFRYREFRKKYGENRYWWISYFQTFILQGLLMWLISLPLLGAQYYAGKPFGIIDIAALIIWITGFIFETGGDIQLMRFRSDTSNKGKVLDTGLWRFTRHPNYFGDSAVWWGYGLFSIAAGAYIPAIGSILMTALIIKVSGVSLLERSLSTTKPQYKEYIERTSAFIPWFPKK